MPRTLLKYSSISNAVGPLIWNSKRDPSGIGVFKGMMVANEDDWNERKIVVYYLSIKSIQIARQLTRLLESDS